MGPSEEGCMLRVNTWVGVGLQGSVVMYRGITKSSSVAKSRGEIVHSRGYGGYGTRETLS